MGESFRQAWIRPAAFLGGWYALVGITFAVPAAHVQAWRLAAWVVSAIGYAAHIAYERFRLRNAPSASALERRTLTRLSLGLLRTGSATSL